MKQITIFLMAAFWSYGPGSQLSSAGSRELEKVRAEFPRAMTLLENLSKNVRGKFKRYVAEDGGTRATTVVYATNKSSRKAHITYDDSRAYAPGEEAVRCVSPAAYFQLSRNSSNVPYMLSAYNSPDGQDNPLEATLDQYLYAPCSIRGFRMTEFMANPTFAFNSAEEVVERGRPVMKINFSIKNHEWLISGVIFADPSNGWSIQKSDCETTVGNYRKQRLVCEAEYEALPDGSSSTRLVTLSIPGPGPQGGPVKVRCETLEFERKSTPDSEFTPQFYGLPDLTTPGKDRSRNEAPFWLLGMAFLALVVAVAMKYYSTRLQRR